MKNKWLIAVLCTALAAVNLQAKVMEGSVATVNGKPVLSSEYDAYLEGVIEQYQAVAPEVLQQPNAKDMLGREVLKELISKELLYQAAEEAKVQVKDSEIDDGINEIKTRFIIDEKTGKEDPSGADKRFNEALKKQGLTLKRYKEKIKRDIAVRKLMEDHLRSTIKPVEEAEARELYENVDMVLKNNTKKIKALEKKSPEQLKEAQAIAAKLKQLTAEQVRIGHIYLAVTKDMKPEEVKKKEELAKQIKKEIDGGMEFSAAVQKYTEDKASLTSGGDMILIKGIAPKEIDEKAFSLSVGKVSAPIKTDVGFHIIKIKEKRAAKEVAFEDVARELGQYLAQKRVQKAMADYLEALRGKADIKITKTFASDEPAQAPSAAKPAEKDAQ
ncbi:MAG: SurA N-terminal domain-containing protein [Elusimicrobiaceae bacterium]|nr:SurA N-terminal domain-containing protein [Elusimicrobiaceae bacterium]